MKPTDRDNLLIRLDERTSNIWRAVEELAEHNKEQNGFILQSLTRSSGNRIWLKIITGAGSSIAIALLTKLVGLW